MPVDIEVDGENAKRFFREVRDGIPDELRVAMDESLQPIHSDMAEYPPQRPPAHPNRRYVRGRGTEYTRKDGTIKLYPTSQRYGAKLNRSIVRNGSEIVGTINSPATYSTYLRGTAPGTPSYGRNAWMHQGVWRTLKQILDERLPAAIKRLEKRLQAFFDKYDS